MASTFVNDLRLNEQATGDNSGSWGTVTNTNLELIAEAFSFGTEAITTNADTHATTIADGGTDPGRSMFLKYTGTLDSACTITIGPNTVSKMWFIENGTSGSQNIIIKQGSGATITIPPGDTKAIYSDGAGSSGAMVDAFASLSVVDLNVSGNLDVDGTANLDAVDIDGAVQIDNTVSVGVNDTGYDVKFFGDTASAFMLWDASADDLILGGAAGLSVNSAALVTGVLTTTAATVFNGGFTANEVSTISDATSFSAGLTIANTADTHGSVIDFFNNSSSPADNDYIGGLIFKETNSAGGTHSYAKIFGMALDITDTTEDGAITFETSAAGANTAEIMRITNAGVGIGTATPDGTLHVHTATAGTVTASTQADDLVVESNTEAGITILSPDDQSARIRFSSPSTNTDVGGALIFYRQNINKMRIGTAVAGGVLGFDSGAGVEAMLIAADGAITSTGTVTTGGAISASTFAASTSLNVSRAQGSSSSPAAMANGQVIGSLNFNGYTSAGAYRIGGQITAAVDAGVSGDELPTNLKFATTADGANSPTTRMTIENDGDVTIEDGNLVIGTAGHGIDFSATTDGAGTDNSSVLSDYEEGSFSPVLTVNNSLTGVTQNISLGRYIKVGRHVTAWLHLRLTAKGSSTGHVRIQGFPYAASNLDSTDEAAAGTCAFWDSLASAATPGGYMQKGTTKLLLINNAAGTASPSLGQGALSNTSSFYYQVCYNTVAVS